MIERLEVHNANNKYSYYYKNLNSGRTIKKEGRGRKASKYNVYEELREKYKDLEENDEFDDNQENDHDEQNEDDKNDSDDSGINVEFDIKIDLSDLFN